MVGLPCRNVAQEESTALNAAGASPDLCLILGDMTAMPDERSRAILGLNCPARQLTMDSQDVEQVTMGCR